MKFDKKIYKKIKDKKILKIGEVKTWKCYLYADHYEVFITELFNRKTVKMELRRLEDRMLVMEHIGTVNNVLDLAIGHIKTHSDK